MTDLGFRMFLKQEDGQVFELNTFETLLDLTHDVCMKISEDASKTNEIRKAAGFSCKWMQKLFIEMLRNNVNDRAKNNLADQYAVSDTELISSLVNQQKGD